MRTRTVSAVMFFLIVLAAGMELAPVLAKENDTFGLPPGRAGTQYEFRIATEGGHGPLKWKAIEGAMPAGLELDAATGTLKGVPTAARVAAYEFVVEVSDSSEPPQRFTQRFSLKVEAAPLRIVLPPATLKILPPVAPDDVETNGESKPAAMSHPTSTAMVSSGTNGSLRKEAAGTDAATNPGARSTLAPEHAEAGEAKRAATDPEEENDEPKTAIIEGKLRQWDYVISGKMPKRENAKEVLVKVKVNDQEVKSSENELAKERTVFDAKGGAFVFWMDRALVKGDKVQVQQAVDGTEGTWSPEYEVEEAEQEDEESEYCQRTLVDCRDTFGANFYVGMGIDTFASGPANSYLNPDAGNGPKERAVGGIDFEYRVLGRPATKIQNRHTIWSPQLWVYGETAHGLRSSDFDCSGKNSTFFACANNLPSVLTPGQDYFYILRNATSLEAFTGVRLELLNVQIGSVSPASLYLKGQAGFLTAAGRPDDVVDIHHWAIGMVSTRGKFQDSYLEVGKGRNDLFVKNRNNRWKIDGYLAREMGKGFSVFFQMVVDADGRPGSDSVQSYFGIEYDLRHAWDLFKKNPTSEAKK